jgi:integrase
LLASYAERKIESWSPRTLVKYARYFRQLEEHFPADHQATQITVDDVQRFADNLAAQGATPHAIASLLGFARSIYSEAMAWGRVIANPFAEYQHPVPSSDTSPDPFTQYEIQSLLTTCRERFRWFYPPLLLAALSGCRRGELVGLNVGDIVTESGTVFLRANVVKTRRARAFVLPEAIRNIVTDLALGKRPDHPLFTSRRGTRLSVKSFDLYVDPPRQYPSAWRRLQEAAGVRPRRFHALRSSLVTNLVEHGEALDRITLLTGHTPNVARRHYLASRPHAQGAVIERAADMYLPTAPRAERDNG